MNTMDIFDDEDNDKGRMNKKLKESMDPQALIDDIIDTRSSGRISGVFIFMGRYLIASLEGHGNGFKFHKVANGVVIVNKSGDVVEIDTRTVKTVKDSTDMNAGREVICSNGLVYSFEFF